MNRREKIVFWAGGAMMALFSGAIAINALFMQPPVQVAGKRVHVAAPDAAASAADTARTRARQTQKRAARAVGKEPRQMARVRVRAPAPDEERAVRRVAKTGAAAGQARHTASLGKAATGNPLVAQVQRSLKRAGYDPGPVDGRLGPATRAAIRHFQRDNGLPETGEVDAGVLAVLLP